MKCPQCNHELNAPANSELPVHNCPICSGTWIRGNELHSMLERSDDPVGIGETLDSILDLEFSESRRQCPSCVGRRLKAVVIENTELDFCASCKGLFFDPGELQRVFPGILGPGRGRYHAGERGFWANLLKFIDHHKY
jgi:Zn-finger nucleic acid-binding protein